MRSARLFALTSILATSLSSVAFADSKNGEEAHASVTQSVVTQSLVVGGSGQDALAVGIAGDALVARVCAKAAATKDVPACDPSGATTIHPPPSVKGRVASASLRKVLTSQKKELIEVTVGASEGRKWVALIAAGEESQPRIAWSGFVSPTDPAGQSANRTEYVSQKDGTGEKIAVTTRVAICDKSAVASRSSLDPKTLRMVSLGIDDPAPEARKSATKLTAKKLGAPPKTIPLLHTPRASTGSGALLVDGDPATAWTEDAPGAGTNQFVAMTASEAVAVLGFDLQLSVPADVEGPRAPKTLLLITRDRSFAVDVPEDASLSGGASFSVDLPEPIHTRCVGVVLGDAYPAKAPEKSADGSPEKGAPKNAAAATTYVNELSLRTRFEGSSADDLAKALRGGGDEARARADLLGAAGDEGVAAAVRAYDGLDGPGQDLARRVIDASGCDQKLALYVPMLASKDEDAQGRAHDRVRRCGKEAGPALLAQVMAQKGAARSVFAEELALLSPDTAVPALVSALAAARSPAERLLFRKALVKASERESSLRAFDAALAPDAFTPLPIDAKLDLLRAMGKRLGETKMGATAFGDVSKEATDFRGRYLLLGPAAALARGGDSTALAALTTTLSKDPDARIRARAAEVSQGIPSFDGVLLSAAADPAVRVREAATRSLEGKKLDAKEQVKLATALPKEPWTFVRRAVVQALTNMKGDAQVDATLALAMEHEEQPTVRQDILEALGTRGARSQRDAIKDRAYDMGEAVDVRVQALRALGMICDTTSLEDLTKVALKGATPFYEADRKLSTAAISSLGRLHPKDLAVRLQPLMTEKVPGDVHESARSALSETHVCH